MIENINRLSMVSSPQSTRQPSIQDTPVKRQSFANHLQTALEHVDHLQKLSDEKTKQMVNGEITDLHDVMITAQKASLTLETTVQIQRKVIDAYNEIMRMQV
ncbi:MAG TPA: flagellar hook-basal body complex protein FliE [Bacillota bacterium]|nr:flagellar hook-basal body complex protein FliE [Bacillota bacterium]